MAKKNKPYLTNKELLYNIHQSKLSYCYFNDNNKTDYDLIVDDLGNIPEDKLRYALQKYAKKQNKLNNTKYLETDFSLNDLTVRVMTDEHIPSKYYWTVDQYEVRMATSNGYTKLCFAPFKQYIFRNKKPILVGLSHHNENFEFDNSHGRMTNELGRNFKLLTYRISHKPNFIGYTYLDDMRGTALMRLCEVGLFFDEDSQKYPNPFAYYTRVVLNCFNQILNTEKNVRNIKIELIEQWATTTINNVITRPKIYKYDK